VVQRFGSDSARVHFCGWGAEYSEVHRPSPSLHPLSCPRSYLRIFIIGVCFTCHNILILRWNPQVMKSNDLLQRTRPRQRGTPTGQICCEVSSVFSRAPPMSVVRAHCAFMI
jgi:hypothetical protein